jgi:hypothetical protein
LAGIVETLRANREAASRIADRIGSNKTRAMLQRAESDLIGRLAQVRSGPGSFSEMQLKATLAQVRDVLRSIVLPGMRGLAVEGAEEAAASAARGTVSYLTAAEAAYAGVGAAPLALDEARVTDAAVEGARASVLRRLASSGKPSADPTEPSHPAAKGILQRYGMNVIGHFEDVLRIGLVTRAPLETVRANLIEQSPFLKGAPASWAERIARTETIASYNRAGYEATREADEQLGDLVKILAATFDNRTGGDSWGVHGEVRRPEEAFEYVDYKGAHTLFQHPPNRPNDREIVVTHRISWPVPKYLWPKSDAEVAAAYGARKQRFPGRPAIMSTVTGMIYR